MGFASGLMIPMILSVIFLSKSLKGLRMNSIEIDDTRSCHPIAGRFSVSHWDEAKGGCRDKLDIQICGGLCGSSETGTWRFPHSTKVSHTCKPDNSKSITVPLCEEGVRNMRTYTYTEAISCKCDICSSSDASCLSATKRGRIGLSRGEFLPTFPIAKYMGRRIALAERMIDDSDDDYGRRITPFLE